MNEIICSGWVYFGNKWKIEEINKNIALNNQYLLYDDLNVHATVWAIEGFVKWQSSTCVKGVNANDYDSFSHAIGSVKPDVLINYMIQVR